MNLEGLVKTWDFSKFQLVYPLKWTFNHFSGGCFSGLLVTLSAEACQSGHLGGG